MLRQLRQGGLRRLYAAAPRRHPLQRVPDNDTLADAIGLGVAGGAGLVLVPLIIPAAGLFYLPLMIGLGYLIGEGVTAAVNRRRGRPYQYLALLGVALATAPVWLFASVSFSSLIGLAGVACAGVFAWRRLDP